MDQRLQNKLYHWMGSLRLVFSTLLLLLVFAQVGFAQFRLPAIDPLGRQLFLPQRSTQILSNPLRPNQAPTGVFQPPSFCSSPIAGPGPIAGPSPTISEARHSQPTGVSAASHSATMRRVRCATTHSKKTLHPQSNGPEISWSIGRNHYDALANRRSSRKRSGCAGWDMWRRRFLCKEPTVGMDAFQ